MKAAEPESFLQLQPVITLARLHLDYFSDNLPSAAIQ